MVRYYLNDWSPTLGWFLWFGFVFLFFAALAVWAFTYKIDQKGDEKGSRKEALDIINERYAHGKINNEDYARMKSNILKENKKGRAYASK